mmetsp:Transcript_76146/g.182148  ORF Transcript_76146/g.182148 Transcript_76146/m.182148 type:complete len:200 (-) Transcript_76146:227-826(-)
MVNPGSAVTVQVSRVALPLQSLEVPRRLGSPMVQGFAVQTGPLEFSAGILPTYSANPALLSGVSSQSITVALPPISQPGSQNAVQISPNSLLAQESAKWGSEKGEIDESGKHCFGRHSKAPVVLKLPSIPQFSVLEPLPSKPRVQPNSQLLEVVMPTQASAVTPTPMEMPSKEQIRPVQLGRSPKSMPSSHSSCFGDPV